MAEALQIRIHGDAQLPTLIYLPGLHGDWTLVGKFRNHLAGRVRFVEFTYPRTLEWSLDDYAANLEAALAQNGITNGWLLGESFGSQILWALIGRGKFPAQGIILAGGFVRHPLARVMRLVERYFGTRPFSILVWMMYGFTKIVRSGFSCFSKNFLGLDEFVSRRTRLDGRAAVHRLHLIAENDPRAIARASRLPVYYLSGLIDPVVPWFFVQRWLKKNCPALRDTKIVALVDHNILGSGSKKAAAHILEWIKSEGQVS
jgi:pimeloyl-ACP methyl ester carboxylesterase